MASAAMECSGSAGEAARASERNAIAVSPSAATHSSAVSSS